MNTIEKIQDWYAAQCNGDWEHYYGVAIDTLDNPGWSVSIDLVGSNLESVAMQPYKHDNGAHDWVFCEIRDGKFTGNGDASKLNIILEVFIKLLASPELSGASKAGVT